MMTVRLIAHTPEPEKVVAAAAKLCYSDAHITDLLDGLDEEKTARFLTMLSDLGHASPIEHASFTFGIEGVSRTLLAQITRHRIASFSVQSQRYVRLDDFRYVTPPEIEAIPEAKAAFLASMEEDAQRYLDLTRSKFGIGSYEALLTFAQHCQKYVPNVVLTVVDHVESEEEIAKCRKICEDRGLTLRVRAYEAN